MPRQSRIDAPGALHHLIIRGIERKTIFKDDADRYGFIERIESIFSRIAINPSFRRKYREFVEGGIGAGRRPELVGGGLIRSVGGWKQAKILLKGQERVKGDERILGDTDFVQNVLKRCNENYLRKYRLTAQGVELDTLSKGVAAYFNLTCDQLNTPGRYPAVVQARSPPVGSDSHRTGPKNWIDPTGNQYLCETGRGDRQGKRVRYCRLPTVIYIFMDVPIVPLSFTGSVVPKRPQLVLTKRSTGPLHPRPHPPPPVFS